MNLFGFIRVADSTWADDDDAVKLFTRPDAVPWFAIRSQWPSNGLINSTPNTTMFISGLKLQVSAHAAVKTYVATWEVFDFFIKYYYTDLPNLAQVLSSMAQMVLITLLIMQELHTGQGIIIRDKPVEYCIEWSWQLMR